MGAGEIQAASTVLLSFQSFKLGGEIRGVYFITLHSSYVLHIYIYIFFVTNKHFTNLNHLKHMIYPCPQPQASSGLGTSLIFSDKWSPFSACLLKPGTRLSARGACQVGQGRDLSVFTPALPSVWSSLLLFPHYSSTIQTLSS